MRFEFATAARIVFGAGVVREAAAAAAGFGRRALLVTGRTPERARALIGDLAAAGIAVRCFAVAGEPTVEMVSRAAGAGREYGAELVIAIGGGTAIDAGKAAAALLANPGDPLDYLEVVGRGRPLASSPAPFLAIPTTAGTGSEVTRNAVLGVPEQRVKASLRSPLLLPRLALVDPDLTLGLPPDITASTGLDALTQLIEPYVSPRANAMTDLFCLEGMRLVSRSLRRAWRDGQDRAARTDMSRASLLGGLALANAGLGVVHGFAAPAGGMFPAPHGALCAALLPHGMALNIRALRARAPESEALRRYEVVARTLTGESGARAEDGAAWAARLCAELGIPRLRAYGVEAQDLPVLAEKAARASSMKANPIALNPEELLEVAARAL